MRRMSDLCGLRASPIEFNHGAWEVSMNQQSILRTALFCQLPIGISRNTIREDKTRRGAASGRRALSFLPPPRLGRADTQVHGQTHW